MCDKQGGARLPGMNPYRFVRGPQGWHKPTKGDRRLEQLAPPEYDDADDWLQDEWFDALHGKQGEEQNPTLLTQQAAVESVAEEYATLWQEDVPQFQPPDGPLPSSSRITIQDIKEAALSFPADTGLGPDAFSPRAVAFLPHCRLQQLADLLMRCEETGTWPKLWQLVMIVLLPKPCGGKRPIGLFPTMIRIWMRVRSKELRKWEEKHNPPSMHGATERSAGRAAWLAALDAEEAAGRDSFHAQALLDLAKAFEAVPHEALWTAARQYDYPLATLRLALAAYRAPRAFIVNGICSRTVRASRGITAGSGTATAELRLLMLDLLPALSAQMPNVKVDIYVDDVNLEVTLPNPAARQQRTEGKAKARLAKRVAQQMESCARQIAAAVDVCAVFFEDLHKMRLSITKSCFISSSQPIATRAASLTRCRGIKGVGRGKMLGYETTAGRGRVTSGIKKRISKFKVKANRIKKLRGTGINVKAITRATGMPAMAYGLDATGASDSMLATIRRTVAHATTPSTAGGNLDCTLMAMDGAAGRLDPVFDAHALPIMTWARAVFCGWRPHERMQEQWRRN